jgi:hypothetical protein
LAGSRGVWRHDLDEHRFGAEAHTISLVHVLGSRTARWPERSLIVHCEQPAAVRNRVTCPVSRARLRAHRGCERTSGWSATPGGSHHGTHCAGQGASPSSARGSQWPCTLARAMRKSPERTQPHRHNCDISPYTCVISGNAGGVVRSTEKRGTRA